MPIREARISPLLAIDINVLLLDISNEDKSGYTQVEAQFFSRR
jgi:hypothetical protein